ncbi:MAG: hypothetical protein DMF76_01600 [Acidobacteria bacterium]|nr:MAG: hypothetical protein DMF76_01600 [Acidobacteriota bacterium]
MTFNTLEKICQTLRCQPGAVFETRPRQGN